MRLPSSSSKTENGPSAKFLWSSLLPTFDALSFQIIISITIHNIAVAYSRKTHSTKIPNHKQGEKHRREARIWNHVAPKRWAQTKHGTQEARYEPGSARVRCTASLQDALVVTAVTMLLSRTWDTCCFWGDMVSGRHKAPKTGSSMWSQHIMLSSCSRKQFEIMEVKMH